MSCIKGLRESRTLSASHAMEMHGNEKELAGNSSNS